MQSDMTILVHVLQVILKSLIHGFLSQKQHFSIASPQMEKGCFFFCFCVQWGCAVWQKRLIELKLNSTNLADGSGVCQLNAHICADAGCDRNHLHFYCPTGRCSKKLFRTMKTTEDNLCVSCNNNKILRKGICHSVLFYFKTACCNTFSPRCRQQFILSWNAN